MIEEFKLLMQKKFDMVNIGLMKYFSGIEIQQFSNVTFICQQKYASDIIKKFIMTNCKLIGTLISLATKLSKQDVAPQVDSTLY